MLADDTDKATRGARVRYEAHALAEAHSITGVPHFVVNGKYSIPGAQDPEVFARSLAKILDRATASRSSPQQRTPKL